MDTIHKYLVVPVVLVSLSIAFILICCAVAITRGRPSWVSRKLAVGAMIFALQSVSGIPAEAMATCYEQPLAPSVAVDETVARDSRQVLPGYEAAGAVEVLRVPSGVTPDFSLSVLDGRGDVDFTYQLILGSQIVESGAITYVHPKSYQSRTPAAIHFTSGQLDRGTYLLKFFRGPDPSTASSVLCRAYGVLVE